MWIPNFFLQSTCSLPLYLPEFDARVLSTSDIGSHHAGGESIWEIQHGRVMWSRSLSWVASKIVNLNTSSHTKLLNWWMPSTYQVLPIILWYVKFSSQNLQQSGSSGDAVHFLVGFAGSQCWQEGIRYRGIPVGLCLILMDFDGFCHFWLFLYNQLVLGRNKHYLYLNIDKLLLV